MLMILHDLQTLWARINFVCIEVLLFRLHAIFINSLNFSKDSCQHLDLALWHYMYTPRWRTVLAKKLKYSLETIILLSPSLLEFNNLKLLAHFFLWGKSLWLSKSLNIIGPGDLKLEQFIGKLCKKLGEMNLRLLLLLLLFHIWIL